MRPITLVASDTLAVLTLEWRMRLKWKEENGRGSGGHLALQGTSVPLRSASCGGGRLQAAVQRGTLCVRLVCALLLGSQAGRRCSCLAASILGLPPHPHGYIQSTFQMNVKPKHRFRLPHR